MSWQNKLGTVLGSNRGNTGGQVTASLFKGSAWWDCEGLLSACETEKARGARDPVTKSHPQLGSIFSIMFPSVSSCVSG